MTNILILCTGNSCRSQLAHAYFEQMTDGRSVKVYSAGVETHGVNPRAIKVLAEDDIDINHYTSNNVDEYVDIEFDYLLTVCDNAKERCPVFPIKGEKFHYNFPDPAKAIGTEEEIMEQFRAVRDQIKEYVREFVENKIK